MDVIYVLIPIVLLFGFLVVVAFIWMAKKGFFDDLDGQAHRILMDDDDFEKPSNSKSAKPQAEKNTESPVEESTGR